MPKANVSITVDSYLWKKAKISYPGKLSEKIENYLIAIMKNENDSDQSIFLLNNKLSELQKESSRVDEEIAKIKDQIITIEQEQQKKIKEWEKISYESAEEELKVIEDE